MIDEIRLFLAVALSLGFILFTKFSPMASWVVIGCAVICFILAHYVKPYRDAGDGSTLLDIIASIIEASSGI